MEIVKFTVPVELRQQGSRQVLRLPCAALRYHKERMPAQSSYLFTMTVVIST